MSSDSLESRRNVKEHYSAKDLESIILGALADTGKDLEHLKVEDLAPVDEFHIRGLKATVEMAEHLDISDNIQVLDLGCGLGGASRFLAHQYGCSVVGIDLSDDYCRAATFFTRHLGLDSKVSFLQGNAVDLPFSDASFDIVWTQHSSMNISNKSGLYSEIWRVLRPGGRLALNDVLSGTGGDVYFPVPWARDPSISYLLSSEELLDTLREQGFEVILWQDQSEAGTSWFRKMREKLPGNNLPPVGIHLLLGHDFKEMSKNLFLNLQEKRIVLIEAILRRR